MIRLAWPAARRMRAFALVALVSVPAIGATLTFTLPAFHADTASCGPGQVPLDDLESVYVYGQPRYARAPVVLARARVAGLEGEPWALAIPEDTMQTVWVVTTVQGGRRSCPSNLVSVGGRAGVSGRPSIGAPQLYDLSGRRASRPLRPGVYFVREGHGRPGRIVVVR